jgi:hypothetical protein
VQLIQSLQDVINSLLLFLNLLIDYFFQIVVLVRKTLLQLANL